MAKYKFTRVYVAEAATKAEALEKVKNDPAEYLEYEGSTVIQTERGGLAQTFRKQITGK